MANEAVFLDPQDLKSTSSIDENVDEKLVREAIVAAQDLYIEPLIGSGLFDQLQSQIIAGSVTVANAALLEQIRKPLKWWSLYEGAYSFQFKVMNKGVSLRQSASSTTIEKNDLVAMMDEFRAKAQAYSKRLQMWLLENESTYPLYSDPGDGVDVIVPKRENYDPGIYLEGYGGTDPSSFIETSYNKKNDCDC